MNLPSDVAQQALDAAGIDYLLGDLEDGARPAQVTLRAFQQCLMQLLRACHWDFARRETPLTLLADSTGQTPNAGQIMPDCEFQYMYAYPGDCMKIRFIPWRMFQNPGAPPGNILPPEPNLPLMTGLNQAPNRARLRPARYVISNDPNYPPPPGTISWEVQGVSPQGRTVILTNVQNAKAVYTYLCLYPSVWDSLFRAALVAYLASEIALPLHADKKLGLEIRNQQMQIAKEKILQARVANGNETWSVNDLVVDWMQTRHTGAGAWGFGGGRGLGDGAWGGLDDCCGAGVVASAAF